MNDHSINVTGRMFVHNFEGTLPYIAKVLRTFPVDGDKNTVYCGDFRPELTCREPACSGEDRVIAWLNVKKKKKWINEKTKMRKWMCQLQSLGLIQLCLNQRDSG